MSELMVLGFENEAAAEEFGVTLAQMQKDMIVQLQDASMVVRDPDGKPHVKHGNKLVGAGALGGAFWGMLFGLHLLRAVPRARHRRRHGRAVRQARQDRHRQAGPRADGRRGAAGQGRLVPAHRADDRGQVPRRRRRARRPRWCAPTSRTSRRSSSSRPSAPRSTPRTEVRRDASTTARGGPPGRPSCASDYTGRGPSDGRGLEVAEVEAKAYGAIPHWSPGQAQDPAAAAAAPVGDQRPRAVHRRDDRARRQDRGVPRGVHRRGADRRPQRRAAAAHRRAAPAVHARRRLPARPAARRVDGPGRGGPLGPHLRGGQVLLGAARGAGRRRRHGRARGAPRHQRRGRLLAARHAAHRAALAARGR